MRYAVLCLALISVTACGIAGPDRITLHIAGTVRDQANQPVGGAIVELYPPSLFIGSSNNIETATRDLQGHYSMSHQIDKPCTGNGFGLVVIASNGTQDTDPKTVDCTSANQQIDLSFVATQP